MGRNMGRAIDVFWLSLLITGILDSKQHDFRPTLISVLFTVTNILPTM